MNGSIDISFLLPTNRSPQYASNFLNKLATIDSKGYSYETVVCSPYEHNWGENTKSLKDNQNAGPIAAFNAMISVAKGEYLVCVIDDHLPVDNGHFFDFVEWLNNDFYMEKRFKITSFNTGHIAQRVPILKETWCGNIIEEYNYRHHVTVRFPILSKDIIFNQLQGYIFHPGFKYHASDLWLGFYIGEEEHPCHECDAQIEQYISLCNYKNRDEDCRFYHKLKINYIKGNRKYIE